MTRPLTLPLAGAVLRARWRLLAAVVSAVMAAALLAALAQPPRWVATATVVLDPRPDPLSAPGTATLGLVGFVATQVDVARSDRVLERAVARLSRERADGELRRRWQAESEPKPAFERWAMEALRRGLEVRPGREGSVLSLQVTGTEPSAAAAQANAVLDAYTEAALELRVAPAREFTGFFEARVDEARKRLDDARAALAEFRRVNGLAVADERLDIENARLSDLSAQLTALQAQAADSASRDIQARAGQADRLPETLVNPVLTQLRGEIARTESQLSQIRLRLGERHPQVQELTAQRDEQQRRLDAETRRIGTSAAVAGQMLRERESRLQAALAAQRERAVQLKAARENGQALEREVEAAQRALDALRQRQAQASLESQSTQGHVHVLSRAQVPLEPKVALLPLVLGLAAVLGLLLAAALVLLIELRQPRIRSADDLVALAGVPLLAVLAPAAATARRLQGGAP
jgi:chain length determinant protein EpsF